MNTRDRIASIDVREQRGHPLEPVVALCDRNDSEFFHFLQATFRDLGTPQGSGVGEPDRKSVLRPLVIPKGLGGQEFGVVNRQTEPTKTTLPLAPGFAESVVWREGLGRSRSRGLGFRFGSARHEQRHREREVQGERAGQELPPPGTGDIRGDMRGQIRA